MSWHEHHRYSQPAWLYTMWWCHNIDYGGGDLQHSGKNTLHICSGGTMPLKVLPLPHLPGTTYMYLLLFSNMIWHHNHHGLLLCLIYLPVLLHARRQWYHPSDTRTILPSSPHTHSHVIHYAVISTMHHYINFHESLHLLLMLVSVNGITVSTLNARWC